MLAGLIRSRCGTQALKPLRLLCTTPKPDADVAVDKALLSKLRKKTGFPLLNCKKALEQFHNDIKEAEKWMRETAQKEGWEKAGKLQDRPMSQGLVSLLEDDHATTIIEVNCETDFVARNEKFQALVTQLTEACHRNLAERDQTKVLIEKEELNALPDQDNKTLKDLVALTIGTLGENIALRRASCLKKEPDTCMSNFVHAAGPHISMDRCRLGKFAAAVKIEVSDADLVAKQLCQHIVGMNPKEIGDWSPPPVDKKELKKKKKGKSEENEATVVEERESRLYDQEFLLDNKSVRGYLQDNGPRVVDFVRLECGEELGEDD